jgi:hypothetical protein
MTSVHLINIVAMKQIIRITLALCPLFLIGINGFAGAGSVRPVDYLMGKGVKSVQKLDSFLSSVLVVSVKSATADGSEKTASSARICSCQILNLESSNYNHRHIAVFAEKTNHGSSSDFSTAKNRIEKEKKHLKQLFYDKVKVVAEVNSTGTCHAMYIRLKSNDSDLQVYDILNADIR